MKARQLARDSGVTIHTAVVDLFTYDLAPSSWDVVVAIWCHLPSARRARLFRQVASALRPTGAVVVESYTPEQLALKTGGPPDPDLLPTLAALREELTGLDLAIGREVRRDIHEGALHNGPSAVVQVLGVKAAAA